MNSKTRQTSASAVAWLDSDNVKNDPRLLNSGRPQSEPDRWLPFIFLHLGCLLIIPCGVSAVALWTCAVLYVLRMFAITGFYHRYFSHRTFKTSRAMQFIFAVIGCMSVQRGPLWWAAHHRKHHAASDTDEDIHSPVARSFLWSHIAWITSTKNMVTDYSRISDFARYPELRWLNRFDWFVPLMLFFSLYGFGQWLHSYYPQTQTDGMQMLAWGFFVSTTILFHATAAINSVAHLAGYRRYDTPDNSRNNPILAIFTLGEGWHNNHHRYSNCTRQGIAWWEVDITYYVLRLFELFGLVSDIKKIPENALSSASTNESRSRP